MLGNNHVMTRLVRTCLSLVLGIGVLSAIVLVAPAATAATVVPPGAMQQIEGGYYVNGNVISVGNGVLECIPTTSGTCAGIHSGTNANNNGNMHWIDSDDKAATFNSSDATVTIPGGATVAKAWLFWSADGAIDGSIQCVNNTSGFVGEPIADVLAMRPTISVDGGAIAVSNPPSYTSTQATAGSGRTLRVHGATDVTAILKSSLPAGTHTVTVGNVVSSQGPGCGAGWALHLSYDYGSYQTGNADSYARKVYTYFGLDQVDVDNNTSRSVTIGGFKTQAPGADFLVTVTEGDSSSPSTTTSGFNYDTAEVTWPGGGPVAVTNARGDTVNVFRSHAQGNQSFFPGISDTDFTNGSVDTFTDEFPTVPAGTQQLTFTFKTRPRNDDGGFFQEGYNPQALTLAVPVAMLGIDKTAVNGDDQQFVTPGTDHDTPTFKITVRNDSGVDIKDGHLTDPLVTSCTLNGNPVPTDMVGFVLGDLDVGDSVVLTCTGNPALLGQVNYDNTATATGNDPTGDPVPEVSDTSHVLVSHVKLEKTADPLVVEIGEEVTWHIKVTNDGDTRLEDVQLTDTDCTGTLSAPSGPGAPNALAPGDSWDYTCTEPLQEGKTNNASVTAVPHATVDGEDVTGAPVSDEDDASAQVAGLKLVKKTNGEDANNPTGPHIPVGGTVTWTYEVSNTGEVPLGNITVTDDQGVQVPATPTSGDTDQDGFLDVDETWIFTATGTATAGQYANLGSVTGTYDDDGDPQTPPVRTTPATDPSHYFGDNPRLHVVKTATPDSGTVVKPGQVVTYSVKVDNTGNVPLEPAEIDDDLSDVLDDATYVAGSAAATSGTVTVDTGAQSLHWEGDLPVDGSATITYQVRLKKFEEGAELHNVVVGTGTNPENPGTEVPSNCPTATTQNPDCQTTHPVEPLQASLDIVKKTNGFDANNPTGPHIPVGDTVTWTYEVTNTGEVPIGDVTVTDDQGVEVPATPTSGDTDNDGLLDVDETWIFTATGTATAGQYANLGTVTGTYDDDGDPQTAPEPVTPATDPSHYFGDDPSLHVEKTATPDSGTVVKPGQVVTYSVKVDNTGNVPLEPAEIDDDLSDVLDDATYVAGSAAATSGTVTVDTGAQSLHWEGDLPVDGSATITYQVKLKAFAPGAHLHNVVTGTGTNPENPETEVPSNCPPPTGDERSQAAAPALDEDCETEHPVQPLNAGLNIVKYTNGFDANEAPGPHVPVGSTVTWTYVVTNTGEVPIGNVTVTDNQGVAVPSTPTSGDTDGDGMLDVNETWTFTATGIATAGQYANIGTVNGTYDNDNDPETPPVATGPDSDPSHYHGDQPGMHVEKKADPPSGSTVEPGQVITYTVEASNTGNTVLNPATVTDDLSDVLDDATYVAGSAKATTGTVTVKGKTLTWTGSLAVGAKATITYKVKVNADAGPDAHLLNVVIGSGVNPENPGGGDVDSNCTDDGAANDPKCHTEHEVATPKNQPKLTTETSDQKVVVGAKLFDKVKISGFIPGHGAKGEATLYGPYTSRGDATCAKSDAVGTVSFKPRNGVITTDRIRVPEPGYYTWVARTTPDKMNQAATHQCGMKSETSLVTKAPYDVDHVATGYDGIDPDALLRRGSVSRLDIARPAVHARVAAVGIRGKSMVIPHSTRVLGWLRNSAAPGDAVGTTVVAGHVSDYHDRPGALYRMKTIRIGQVISYRAGGEVHRYRVVSKQTYLRSRALPDSLFRLDGANRLVVVTCTDKVTRPDGHFHYRRNLVVVAQPIR